MRTVLSRIAGLFRARRLDTQLDEEVRFHLDMLVRDHMRRGLGAEEARLAALRAFGGVSQMKETYRDRRGLPFVETLLQDVRFGARSLMRTPGFTAAALLTLALGIGANSAIFSVVNAVLLKPLPYPEPERIVQMFRNNAGLQSGLDASRFEFSRDTLESFEAVAAWRGTAVNVVTGDSAEYLDALAVSKDYFAVFGAAPIIGRAFEPAEDLPNGPDAVILSHGLWRRLFGSNHGVLGTTVSLGERGYQVVGVMPPTFDPLQPAELYVPLKPSRRGPGGGFNYRVVGRLRQGVGLDEANAESAVKFDGFRPSLSNTLANEGAPWFLPLHEGLSRTVRPALLIMLGAVGMLLLIACANTASLLLARASGRGREVSVRAALGASRWRILRQLVTESVLLFVAGGLVGVVLAYWALPMLLAMIPPGYLPRHDVRVDWIVLATTFAVSVLTGVLFGLAPALSVSRYDLVEAFKTDGTRTTSGHRANWLRRGLVVAEVAMCTLLLVAAGLLIQTFITLRGVDVGFDPTDVLTARMSLRGERYSTNGAVNQLFDRGLDRLRRVPGVRSASVVSGIPIEYGLNLNFDRLETPEREFHLTDWRYVTSSYFETLGIRVVRGRALRETDTRGAPKVAVVSEQFVRQYYPDTNPIGRQIQIFTTDGPLEIVGVAKDLREAGLSGRLPAVMYVPVAQAGDAAIRTSHSYFQVSWVVRASGVSPELRQRIREALRTVDPRQPITAFRSIDEVKARAMQTESFQTLLLSTFAVVGMLLAGAGIYGLIAYSVTQRTREFGIRLALGATSRGLVVSVLRQGAALTAAGIGLGVIGSIGLTRTLESMIVEVGPLNATVLMAVAALLLSVAVLASLVPALRAVRLNPVAALRE
jgi:predicted permease